MDCKLSAARNEYLFFVPQRKITHFCDRVQIGFHLDLVILGCVSIVFDLNHPHTCTIHVYLTDSVSLRTVGIVYPSNCAIPTTGTGTHLRA